MIEHQIQELGDFAVKNGKCVVYVLSISDQFNALEVEYAQQKALELKIPICVVCVVSKRQLKVDVSLGQIEAELRTYRIPLIVLVGEESDVLPGFIHHVKPRRIFTKANDNYDSGKLSVHPYPWPGTVISVEQLKHLF